MTTCFYNHAQSLVNQSIDDLNQGFFLTSWAKTIPARAAFACDSVVKAVELPFAMLGVFFQTIGLFFTWGQNGDTWQNSVARLDITVNQLLNSAIGAVISTQLGSYLHSEGFPSFECIAIAGLVSAMAPYILANLPDQIYITSQGDWIFGWTWWR